ncbi:hypothetical protein ACWD4J_43720 [Streptomyces sp. NPDC002577]
MGVFARFLRRSKGKEEASTAEAPAESLTAESGAETEEAKGSSEVGTNPVDNTDTDAEAQETAEADAEKNTAESVEIPKQQSAEEAADNEAGEGARK